MNQIISYVTSHAREFLSGAAGTIAVLSGANVIPLTHMKYWMAAMAVLTYWSKFAPKPPETKP